MFEAGIEATAWARTSALRLRLRYSFKKFQMDPRVGTKQKWGYGKLVIFGLIVAVFSDQSCHLKLTGRRIHVFNWYRQQWCWREWKWAILLLWIAASSQPSEMNQNSLIATCSPTIFWLTPITCPNISDVIKVILYKVKVKVKVKAFE